MRRKSIYLIYFLFRLRKHYYIVLTHGFLFRITSFCTRAEPPPSLVLAPSCRLLPSMSSISSPVTQTEPSRPRSKCVLASLYPSSCQFPCTFRVTRGNINGAKNKLMVNSIILSNRDVKCTIYIVQCTPVKRIDHQHILSNYAYCLCRYNFSDYIAIAFDI